MNLRRTVAFVACLLALQSCAFFTGKPPLPKHAAIERAPNPTRSADFAALLENADIIYFPTERIGFGAKSEAAALLLEELQRTAKPFAVGWDLIDGRDQSLLDALPAQDAAARLQTIAGLDLLGTGRAREYCRSVLREGAGANVTHLALRYPTEGSDAALVRREFAADKIVRYFRSAGAGAKALIFVREEDLDDEQGVPKYVAQKINARQLVLGSELQKKTRPKLFTRGTGRGFEVVDRAPRAARD